MTAARYVTCFLALGATAALFLYVVLRLQSSCPGSFLSTHDTAHSRPEPQYSHQLYDNDDP